MATAPPAAVPLLALVAPEPIATFCPVAPETVPSPCAMPKAPFTVAPRPSAIPDVPTATTDDWPPMAIAFVPLAFAPAVAFPPSATAPAPLALAPKPMALALAFVTAADLPIATPLIAAALAEAPAPKAIDAVAPARV